MRRPIGVALLTTVLLAACGTAPATPAREPAPSGAEEVRVVDVPVAAGAWEELPTGPLSPRGGTQALWTGSEVLLWGGQAVDPDAEPCPPTASCLAPSAGPEAEEVAAYDPSSRTWRTLTGTPPGYGYPVWARGRAVDQSTAYDPTTGVSTVHPSNSLLVYAQAQVIGSDLVVAGWDYALGELQGVGQVVAGSLDLDDPQAQWRTVEWPLPPPGAENLKTATDGKSLVVVAWSMNPEICGDGPSDCYRLLRFDPGSGAWTDLGVLDERLQELVSGGGRLYGTLAYDASGVPLEGSFPHVVALDPANGSVTDLGDPGSYGNLIVSPAGRVALVGGPDVRVLTQGGAWQRLPAVLGDPVYPAVVWAGEELLVWGGAATPGDPESRNSADGWVFQPPA